MNLARVWIDQVGEQEQREESKVLKCHKKVRFWKIYSKIVI